MRPAIVGRTLPSLLRCRPYHPVLPLSLQRNLSAATSGQISSSEIEQHQLTFTPTPPDSQPTSGPQLRQDSQSQSQPESQPHSVPQSSPSELFYPTSSSQHTSLPTFLSYAERTGLNPSTTLYIGTHYEYTTITALRRLGFSLQRVGGRDDYGIDLLGTWSLPARDPLRVLVQCKVSKKAAGPRFIRELEGAFIGAPSGWRDKGVIGLLVTEKTATKGIRDAIGRSKWPMAFVTCSREGLILQLLWNGKAAEKGLLDLAVGVRHTFVGEEEGDQVEGAKEVVLTCRGKRIPPVKEKKIGEQGAAKG